MNDRSRWKEGDRVMVYTQPTWTENNPDVEWPICLPATITDISGANDKLYFSVTMDEPIKGWASDQITVYPENVGPIIPVTESQLKKVAKGLRRIIKEMS